MLDNYLVLICAALVWFKVIAFSYFTNLLDGFPYIFRSLIIGLLITFVLFSPLYFLKKTKNFFAVSLNLILSLVFVIDLIYMRYFNAIPSLGILNTIGQSSDVIPAIQTLFRPWDIIFILDIFVLVIFHRPLYNLVHRLKAKTLTKAKKHFVTVFAFFLGLGLLASAFTVDLATNGFFFFAVNNVIDNKIAVINYGIIGAHTFDLYRNISQDFRKLTKKEEQEIVNWVNSHKYKQTDNSMTGVAKGKNIIMIQVESLQNFVINKKVEGQEITPNLNKLVAGSHYFANDYFETGGGGTSDADMSANTSLYPSDTESAFVKYGESNFTSIEKELKKEGYSSYAYHAYNRSFWNRDVAFPSLGFDKFISQESYPKGEVINLGLNDKTFLDKTAELIKNQPKPSFSYAITLSNHTPFTLDAADSHLTLKKDYPELSKDYLETVKYTDEALGEFFNKLKAEGLYDDSTIILYGDHVSNIESFNQGGINYVASSISSKRVPLVIKLPNQTKGETHWQVSSHVDIMPTILNLVGIKTNSPIFGRDIFSNANPFFIGIGHFNTGTVFSGNKRIYNDDNNNTHCEIFDNKKKTYQATKLSSCDGMIDYANQIKDNSTKIIRFNLFKYFK